MKNNQIIFLLLNSLIILRFEAKNIYPIVLPTAQNDSSHTPTDGQDKFLVMTSHWDSLFPMGSISFADEIVLYDPGALGSQTGEEPTSHFQNYTKALGPPDNENFRDTSFVSLGKGGTLIIKFLDNVLVDGLGPDLKIFMMDSIVEEIKVWISQDNKIFHFIGFASSQNSTLDIQTGAEPGGIYPYVKLRDCANQGELSGPALGADIDAIGAINTAIYHSIPIDELFQSNRMALKSEANNILLPIIKEIDLYSQSHITLAAHSDNLGTEVFNLMFSQQWAWTLRDFLLEKADCSENQITAIGLGEAKPIVPNDSENNRRINRRIEILIRSD